MTAANEAGWAVYAVEVAPGVTISLNEEHDHFEWVRPEEAIARCGPAVVGGTIAAAIGVM